MLKKISALVKVIGISSICFFAAAVSAQAQQKEIISQSEFITVDEAELTFHARIDTGASNTSIHATDIHVVGGSETEMKDNVGKTVTFTTENEKGEKKQLSAIIEKVSVVTNSQGRETRYMVKLTIGFGDHKRKVHVNLRDRSKMDYKLLIGRNWLRNEFIVDVSEKKMIGQIAPISIKETGLVYQTRIDTGAVENSLHAIDFKIKDAAEKMEDNVGKIITFTTENELGERKQVTTMITNTSLIRNAQGSEIRYMVELNIGELGEEYLVKVNLRDRSKMKNKLLIGRNWLKGHYLVDVSL